MGFIISYDSGNIEQDVIDTINDYSQENLIELIKSIKFKKDGEKIIGGSIVFRYPDCVDVLSSINDISKVSLETRKFVRKRSYRIDLDKFILKYLNILDSNSLLINFLYNKLKNQIDIRDMFCDILSNENYNKEFYIKCFEIISSEETYNKFLNYDNNRGFFGEFSPKEYVLEISKLLGYREYEIYKSNPVYKYNLVSPEMEKRYFKLRDIINVDLDVLGEEMFNQGGRSSFTLKKQYLIDNDWNASPEIINYVFRDMNQKYTPLEMVSHIYIKLCQALRYNLGYHIKKWSTEYNKARQEGITPSNNGIICSEFTYLATHLINKFVDGIEARCIVTGTDQHLLFGILDKKNNIRINLDSTRMINEFDDLGRIKIGLPLVGIDVICDRENKFREAFDRVYSELGIKSLIETKDLIDAYEQMSSKKDTKIDIYENLCTFFDKMKEKNVVGSELLGAFKRMLNQGYFGNIVYSIVGEDLKLTFTERHMLDKVEDILDGLEENIIIQNGDEYYLLKLDDCKIMIMSKDELDMLFYEDKMVYFNPKHRIEGIGVESCMRR